MAFTSGTATSHNDLLDKLRLYLVAQGWTQLAWTAGATVNDTSTLKVRGPGAGAGKQVFVNIRTLTDSVLGAYSWELRGAVSYDGALPWGGQVSESPSSCYLNLWQNSISYWFYVNDRRFIVVAKCSTNYMSAHCGFILPWGTPAEYPFPLLIAGDFYQRQPWSYANAARRMFCDPGGAASAANPDASAYVRTATGVWTSVLNHTLNAANNYALGPTKTAARAYMWPYHVGQSMASFQSIGQHNPPTWNGGAAATANAYAFESLVPTQQSERPLLPIMVTPHFEAPLGVIDGAYCVGGSGLATEQAIALGARNFKAFQNIARNSADDFFCVEEVA